MLFGLGIRISLSVLVGIVAMRKYGIMAMVTGKRMKHAAIGRAKRSARKGWSCAHSGHGVTDQLPSANLVNELKAARALVEERNAR
jgi:hypothetical protein